MPFNLVFVDNTVVSDLFLFFFLIDLKHLIDGVIAQSFNPNAEVAILIGIPTKKAKSEIETHPVIASAKIY